MFTKSQLNNMNYDMRFSSSPWIKIIADKNTYTHKEDDDLYNMLTQDEKSAQLFGA